MPAFLGRIDGEDARRAGHETCSRDVAATRHHRVTSIWRIPNMILRPRHLSLVTLFAVLPSCSGGSESIGRIDSNISLCGPTPHVPCNTAYCDGESWQYEPLPAGTRCNTTGTCNDFGVCVVPTPPPPPPPTPRVMDFTSTEVTEMQIDSEKTATVVYETANCSSGADPVLHFLKPDPNTGDRIEVAIDDNGAGGVDARM